MRKSDIIKHLRNYSTKLTPQELRELKKRPLPDFSLPKDSKLRKAIIKYSQELIEKQCQK